MVAAVHPGGVVHSWHGAGDVTRGQVVVLVARNATACEAATKPRCRCPCGGKYHGKAHSAEWQQQTVTDLCAVLGVLGDPDQTALPLLGLGG